LLCTAFPLLYLYYSARGAGQRRGRPLRAVPGLLGVWADSPGARADSWESGQVRRERGRTPGSLGGFSGSADGLLRVWADSPGARPDSWESERIPRERGRTPRLC
jgi:hypothetical protein